MRCSDTLAFPPEAKIARHSLSIWHAHARTSHWEHAVVFRCNALRLRSVTWPKGPVNPLPKELLEFVLALCRCHGQLFISGNTGVNGGNDADLQALGIC